MAWVEQVGPDTAQGPLKKIYDAAVARTGTVDNVLQVHGLRPHTLEGHLALYRNVLHHPGNTLPLWYLEAVGVLVSRLNGCEYCDRHHSRNLRAALPAEADYDAYDQALSSEEPGAPFEAGGIAGLIYAQALTLMPQRITEGHVLLMQRAGLDDGQIVEINQVASYFNYVNRVVMGLGVKLEDDEPDDGD